MKKQGFELTKTDTCDKLQLIDKSEPPRVKIVTGSLKRVPGINRFRG
jgi:hypothetical protein